MKTKKYLQILVCLCALSLVSGFASHNEPLGNINNISISPGNPSTKVILESDSPLTLFHSSYAIDRPSTLFVDFDGVETNAKPDLSSLTSSLIKDLRISKIDSDTLRLEVDLKERVPYQIISDKTNTIVELNHIQRAAGKYVLSPEIKGQLTQAPERVSYLTNIDVSENADRVDIKAILSNEAVSNVFVLDQPLRLVVDLYNTYFSTSKSVQSINKLGVKKVRAAQFQISNPYTVTRLVFDLMEPKLYSLKTSDNGLTVSFYKDRTVRSSPAMSKSVSRPAPPVEEKAETPPPIVKEENPAENRPKASELKENPPVEKVTTPKPTAPEEKIELPENLKPEKNGSYIERFQEEQFKPKTISEKEVAYSGDVMTLKFKDADLRDIITYIGEHVGLNVVFDPEVRGVVTCNLVDVPWDQALDILLKTNKMGRTLEGNVLRIAPIGTITREREDLQKLEESKELAGPLSTKSFTLSYSKASDVESLLRNKLSTRGEMIVDNRTNTLVITDVKDRIELLESLIDVFDTPTPQVAIEARIVEATSQFVKNLGIQWGVRGIVDPFYGNQTSLQFPHKVLVDGALIPQGIVTKGIGGPLGGYAINLPAPAFTTAMGVSFANVLDTFRLDMAISALETSGNGRIISSPSVTTQNNQEAEIIQGRQIPVQTVANFTVTTRYMNAALELRATPQITAEGTIIMHLELRNNAADFANLVNGIPPIITQSAMTTVMIPDGGTTVIGGIYRTEDAITRDRVPFFHKIPILGNLFKSFARTKQSRELLIFITPRILR
jgi:type IV pilus secretin PilQ/predicted competence protein